MPPPYNRGPGVGFVWNPTEKQRKLYADWKMFTIQALISCKKGTPPNRVPALLDEWVGEKFPLQEMGFFTIQQFLVNMADSIDVRLVDGRYYIFIKETAVPDEMQHVRQMVLGQRTDRSNKLPSKKHGVYVPARELFNHPNRRPQPSTYGILGQAPIPPLIRRAPVASTRGREIVRIPRDPHAFNARGGYRNYQGQNNVPQAPPRFQNNQRYNPPTQNRPHTSTFGGKQYANTTNQDWESWDHVPEPPKRVTSAPTRRVYLPELDENDNDDYDDGGFDYYVAGQKSDSDSSPPLSPKLPAALSTATQKVVTPSPTVKKEVVTPPVQTTELPKRAEDTPDGSHVDRDRFFELLSQLPQKEEINWEKSFAYGYSLDTWAGDSLMGHQKAVRRLLGKCQITFPTYFIKGQYPTFKSFLEKEGKLEEL